MTYFRWHAGNKRTAHARQSLANQTHPIPDLWIRIVSEIREGWEAAEQASGEGQDSSDVEAEPEAVPWHDVRGDDAEGHPNPVRDGQNPADVFTWTLSKKIKTVFERLKLFLHY